MEQKIQENELKISILKKELLSKKIKTYMFWLLFFTEIFIISVVLFKSLNLEDNSISGDKNVAVINIDKPITIGYINKLMNDIDKVKNNKKVKEFLVILNSPGGSPSASEEFSDYLKDLNKHKKVNMYVEGMAASGGYYIASSIKPLIANKNAIVGSIGVIMPHINISKLAKKIGIEEDNLYQGEYKEPISLFHKISDKNEKYLREHLLTPMYQNFLNTVSKNRGVPVEKLKKFAEGKVYLANNPKIKGVLIDKVSALFKVKEEIKNRLGKDTKFFYVNKKLNSLLGGVLSKANINVNLKLPKSFNDFE